MYSDPIDFIDEDGVVDDLLVHCSISAASIRGAGPREPKACPSLRL